MEASNYLDRIDYYICSGGDHHGRSLPPSGLQAEQWWHCL